ncbi:MAG TPA: hypothetical protein PLL45_11020 [Thermoflexales bacterium]|nr:hypothetical protein [Thermoflexales bacterium]
MNSLSDTHPVIARRQIELIRRLTPEQRSGIAAKMTADAVRLSRAGIARAHPELSAIEVKLCWAEVHYGKALIDRVRAYLRARERLAG